jgi:hypothetical protein
MKFLNAAFVTAVAATATVSAFVAPVPKHATAVVTTSASSSTTAVSMGLFNEFFGAPSTSSTSSSAQQISEGQVRSLFYLWNDALATGDSRIVARRYAEDAILLPTVVSMVFFTEKNESLHVSIKSG